MFGEKILLSALLLKWYLEHGLIITKFYEAIEYNKNVCFKELGESIADARRAGDADKSMEIIAETMKLIGNSLYGRCVMNKEKHVSMNYADDNNITKRINDPHFKDLNKISEDTYEVFSSKRKISVIDLMRGAVDSTASPIKHFKDLNKKSEDTYDVFSSKIKIKMVVPIQVGCAVYDLAKLRMLQFYYIVLINILTAQTLFTAKWTRIVLILPSLVKILKI